MKLCKTGKTIQNSLWYFATFLTLFGAMLLAVAGGPACVQAADDFVIAIDDASRIYFAESNYDGTFADYAYLDTLGGYYSRAVTINDFNNDGEMDFIAGRGIGTTAWFYLFINDGNNNFTRSDMVGTLSNANSYAMDMASGDFNNDGFMDFIANGNHSTTGIFLGDGAGNFTKTELDLGAYGRGMDTADFNQDGNLDFVRARYTSGSIDLYPGNGDGTFGDAVNVGDTGNDPYGVVAGDFNNDGFADIIANDGSGGDPYFFAGNGDNTFADGVYTASLDFDNLGAYDGFDFDGDGNLDIIAVNSSWRRLNYYPGNGDATFGTAVEIGATTYNVWGVSAPPGIPPAGTPTAVITPLTQTINAGGTANLDGSGSFDSGGSIASWEWIFGDGNTSSGSSDPGAITNDYADEGIYYPILIVTDDDDINNIASAQVIVEGDSPVVNTDAVSFGEADALNGNWCLSLDGADYASDDVGLTSYQWNLGDDFTEDFEDNNSDGWDEFAGTWAVDDVDPVGGTYSYRQTDVSLSRTWNLFDKEFDTDLSIDVDVNLVDGSGVEAQILFMAQNHKNNYEFILRGRGLNDVLLYRRVNDSATSLFEYDLPDTSPSFPVENGNTYNIKIECRDSVFRFYLDDQFLFAWSDTTFTSGKVGFSTYYSDVRFDNLQVISTAHGQNADHCFVNQGTYNITLSVSDAAGQTASGVIPMTMEAGDPPVADAGGPYSADETVAEAGGWTFSLDGSGSSDDEVINKYIWDFGLDTFDGTAFQSGKWYTNGGITQDGAVSLTGVNTWDTRYLVTRGAPFPKVKGQTFQIRLMASGSGNCMFGFKNEDTGNFHYNQFPYEFHISGPSIYIYENSASRGYTGYTIDHNQWYDFKIELKETGALYSFKHEDSDSWIIVYDSDYAISDTHLRKGMVVYSSTYSMDDFSETTAGEAPNFTLYRGTGTFDFDLTVYDNAGQSSADTAQVIISAGDPPAGDVGNQTFDENDAQGGIWSADFDATAISDDNGVYLYEWDWDYDGSTFNASGDTGELISHDWDAPGTYTVAVMAWDNALQSHLDIITLTITQGEPPVADSGGPYTFDEISGNAFEGGWTAVLDATDSTDDTGIYQYLWDMGTDTFDGTLINDCKWVYTSAVSQDDQIAIVGNNNWGQQYFFSKDTYARASGMALETTISYDGGVTMIGFKNNTTAYHYNQLTYGIYFSSNNILIFEDGNNRGDTGYDYVYNTPYDIRIELKETQGACYYYRLHGEADWILLYDSDYSNATDFKKGADVNSGSFLIDDLKEIAVGDSPSYRFYGLGSHPVSLTVFDQALQSDTEATTVTTEANDPPVADAGDDKSGDENDAFENTWTLNFNGNGSTDDHGIYKYEWDWDDDGVFDESGISPDHLFSGAGEYIITLKVTDHALQSTSDTLTVTLTNGDPPTAVAGDDLTTENLWPVVFNGAGSSDDVKIYKYVWDFGDNTSAVGQTPSHVYWAPGDYTVTLTVYDNAMQTDTDTLTVHVLAAANAPVANAGGPYNAGAGGPPAYFNGSSSTDDYGIIKYLWDVDDAVDSDSDGTFDNDMDAVGRKPFYTYDTAGTYTVTLTVMDGAGQTDTATTTVNVADNLAPDVICVPWVAGNPAIPHETYNGRSIRLKAIVRDAGDLTYQWNFGDGSDLWPASPAPVTNKYAIEASHTYPDSADGTPFSATLTVWDSNGLSGADTYYIIIQPEDLETKTNIAIDEGLWYLHKSQDKGDGHWASYSSYYASPTGSSIQAFEINGHLQDGDNQENPYVESVNSGFDYMFTQLTATGIASQTYGDPDTNGNGLGIEVNGGRPAYEGGMVMDAIASSNMPLAFARTGGDNIKGRYYHEIMTDMVDMYAWGQDDAATGGGWRYSWNQWPDNSACQWAAIGMLAAKDNFSIDAPQWVKDRNNVWLNTSYDGTGFGYTGPGNGVALTPSGMVQLIFSGKYTFDSRWRTAEDYIADNWYWQDNNYYAAYALVKAFRLARPNPVVTLDSTGVDWYNNPDTGVKRRVVDQLRTDGSWYVSYGQGFSTAWAVIMLTPSLFVQPPVADAGDDIYWAFDTELVFNASGSFHKDAARSIIRYEWDFNGDGTWDFTTTDPADPNATYTYPDPDPDEPGDAPQTFIARMRVTDDNEPPQTDIDTREITVAEPPHPPFAAHGGPYTVTAEIPFALDGSASYDLNPGDSITLYQWDLDNDGVWFDDIDVETQQAVTTYTFDTPGTYYIGLKVWDNGAFNPVGCTMGVDCTPIESEPVYTTVTVEANLPPVADAGGPYTVDEGTALTLDGSTSTDPNGDTLTFAWDLDNDGNYDNSSDESPVYTWNVNGTYTVGLHVTDLLLEDTATAQVTVNDLAPTAEFTWAPDSQQEGLAVLFTDASTSPADAITAWEWDFGGQGASSDQNPSFIFNSEGTYTISLTITDEDGSTDTIDHDIIIIDRVPSADLTGDTTLGEGQTGNYDASGSTSSPDTIVSYEWDWSYDGTTFNASGDTGVTQTHAWSDNGTYTVAVRVTDDDGSTDIATLEISVEENVNPDDDDDGGGGGDGGGICFISTITGN